ncbi:unnamed protein product [Closterium sp. Yama58-4]|nr:unnamed protein product [Closterium sp. Yama58-4]
MACIARPAPLLSCRQHSGERAVWGAMGPHQVGKGRMGPHQPPWMTLADHHVMSPCVTHPRYQQVMHACALHEDTAAMAGGDEAQLADRGLTLSGGQRARLALARALYSDATLLLLDDPLSALDARVARHVSDAGLFGPIARGRTILLCTHSPPVLPLAPGTATRPVYSSPSPTQLLPCPSTRPASPCPTHLLEIVCACWQAVQRSSLVVAMQRGMIVHVAPPAAHAAPALATHFHAPPPLLPLTFTPLHPSCHSFWQAVRRSSLVVAMQHGRIVHVAPPTAPVPALMRGDTGVDSDGACTHDGECMNADTHGLLVRLLREQRGERDAEKGGQEGEGEGRKCGMDGRGEGEGEGVAAREVAGQADGESHDCSTKERHGGSGVDGATARTAGAACEESRQQEDGTLRYCAAVGWPLLALVLASLALMQASRNAADVTLSVWTDAVQHAPDSEAATNAFYLRLFTFIALLNSLLTLLRAFSFARAGMTAAHRVHHELLAAVVRAPLAFFDTNPSGRILNRFSSDLYTVDDSLPFIANILLANSFSLAGIAALLLYTQWTFLLLLLPLTYIYSIIQDLYRQSSRELRRLDSAARSPVYAAFSQLLHGAPTIRAFHAQEHVMRGAVALMSASQHASFSEMAASHATARELLKSLSRVPVMRGTITVLHSLLSLVLYTPRLLFQAATATTAAVSPGLLGLALAYALPIVSLLNGTLTSLADTEKDMVAVERVLEYLDLQHEPDAPPLSPLSGAQGQEGEGAWKDAHAGGEGGAAAGGGERGKWPREGEVEFRRVSMAYRVGLPLVLSDVSFLIPGSSQVGIAGRTGAGKSSLLAALFRLRPLTLPSATTTTFISTSSTSSSSITAAHFDSSSTESGIFIDGVNTAHVSLSCLRTALAIIPQTPLIFHAPIRDNLDPEGKHADVALWDAVRKCHLDAAVGRLGGLDAMVGGAAGGLSLGERQLLCLARVMLRKSKVLCLDECTANIDAATSALMHATIAREFHGVTTITIAHRVSSLLSLPRVLIFEAGALVEDGNPKNLLLNPDSKFALLFRASM